MVPRLLSPAALASLQDDGHAPMVRARFEVEGTLRAAMVVSLECDRHRRPVTRADLDRWGWRDEALAARVERDAADAIVPRARRRVARPRGARGVVGAGARPRDGRAPRRLGPRARGTRRSPPRACLRVRHLAARGGRVGGRQPTRSWCAGPWRSTRCSTPWGGGRSRRSPTPARCHRRRPGGGSCASPRPVTTRLRDSVCDPATHSSPTTRGTRRP